MIAVQRGDRVATGQEEIASEVDDYFSNVFGEAPEREHTLDLDRIRLPTRNLAHLETNSPRRRWRR